MHTPPAPTPPLTAIVGAGMAGLSCAQALTAAGHTVHLFEKSRGASGRLSTRRGDGNGAGPPWQCDHGAQYFTASDPAFRAEVARWQQAGAAALWNARIASFDGSHWSAALTPVAPAAPVAPVERFVGTPRMAAPAACMLQGLGGQAQLHTQTTVQQVQHGPEGWAITSAEHGGHPSRYGALVLAVPAPQVLPLLAGVSTAGTALAASVRMRGSWALMLRCAARVDLPFDGAFINAGPLRWVARDSSKPGRSCAETWLLHASAEWTDAHMEDSADDVAAALLAAFADLGGPAPAAWTAHRWRYADTEPALELGCAWDAALGLGLCGDWLHGGKVEGAWRSGQALAQRVLQAL